MRLAVLSLCVALSWSLGSAQDRRERLCAQWRKKGRWPLPDFCRSSSRPTPRTTGLKTSSCAAPSEGDNGCTYSDMWLIPGSADLSCTRDVRKAENIFDIDKDTVKITPEFIQLPGEFNIEFEASLKEGIADLGSTEFLAKAVYSWQNFPAMEQLQCQDTDANGCGGYGNNCVYCDLCNQLDEVDRTSVKPRFQNYVSQVRGLKCPERIGRYRYRRQFCLNSWRAFDEDGDCKLDFVKDISGDYRKAFRALRQDSYGTLVAQFHLSHNATVSQMQRKMAYEQEVEQNVTMKFREAFRGRELPLDRIAKRTQQRVDAWHKKYYLPWLTHENQVSCLKVSFDVCDQKPVPSRQWGRKWECPR